MYIYSVQHTLMYTFLFLRAASTQRQIKVSRIIYFAEQFHIILHASSLDGLSNTVLQYYTYYVVV